MTEEKKASLVMDYLDECDAATILSVLDCLVSNKDLANVYDSLHAEGIL